MEMVFHWEQKRMIATRNIFFRLGTDADHAGHSCHQCPFGFAASEMFAGLELVKNHDCFQKAEMYYWQSMSRGSNAKIDYLEAKEGVVVPIEVKASTKGSMQSLWLFMRKKALHHAVRTSLENFGTFEYIDKEAQNALRHIDVVPLYAMSNL